MKNQENNKEVYAMVTGRMSLNANNRTSTLPIKTTKVICHTDSGQQRPIISPVIKDK